MLAARSRPRRPGIFTTRRSRARPRDLETPGRRHDRRERARSRSLAGRSRDAVPISEASRALVTHADPRAAGRGARGARRRARRPGCARDRRRARRRRRHRAARRASLRCATPRARRRIATPTRCFTSAPMFASTHSRSRLLTSTAAELGVYLRADPVCAEAARAAPWPANVAVDRARAPRDAVASRAHELVTLLWKHSTDDVRTFLAAERQRTASTVDAYLDAARLSRACRAAITSIRSSRRSSASPTADDRRSASLLDRFVQLVGPSKHVRSRGARSSRSSAGSCGFRDAPPAIRHRPARGRGRVRAARDRDPRASQRRFAAAAAYGLVRYQWPTKPILEHTLSTARTVRKRDLALRRRDRGPACPASD